LSNSAAVALFCDSVDRLYNAGFTALSHFKVHVCELGKPREKKATWRNVWQRAPQEWRPFVEQLAVCDGSNIVWPDDVAVVQAWQGRCRWNMAHGAGADDEDAREKRF